MPIVNIKNAESIDITQNGSINVARYTTANVNVTFTPTIESLNITPTQSAQTIPVSAGIDGYGPVNVSAVTASIDPNIIAENIKYGVTILGVVGNYQGLIPSGTLEITSNNTYDVMGYANAVVNVPNPSTGTLSIANNGIYNVTDYANVNVNVSGGGGGPTSYRAFQIDENSKLVNSTTNPWVPLPGGVLDLESYCFYKAYQGTPANILSGAIDLSSLTEISGAGACQYMFKDCPGITSVNLGSLTEISGANACQSMFENCTGLTSVNLSSLYSCNSKNKSIFDAMFKNCTNLQGSLDLSSLTVANGQYCFREMFAFCSGITSVDLSSLKTIGATSYVCQYMFQGCTSLTSVDLSSLTTVAGYSCYNMFEGCSNLTDVNLASLSKINGTLTFGSAFADCIKLKSLSFPALQTVSSVSAMDDMLLNISNCTLHFPSNMQSVVESLCYPNFGGINTVVLFDLPATNLLTGEDGINYSRNPKYDTATSLAWKAGTYGATNFTPVFYTNGLTDPQLGDVIYSDSACTTAVTTIASIA